MLGKADPKEIYKPKTWRGFMWFWALVVTFIIGAAVAVMIRSAESVQPPAGEKGNLYRNVLNPASPKCPVPFSVNNRTSSPCTRSVVTDVLNITAANHIARPSPISKVLAAAIPIGVADVNTATFPPCAASITRVIAP